MNVNSLAFQNRKQAPTAPRRFWLVSSLGLKILLPVLASCLLTGAVLVALFSEQLSYQAHEDLRSRLESFTAGKAAELVGPVWNFQDQIVHKLMQSYTHNHDLLKATLQDAGGEILLEVRGQNVGEYDETLTASHELVNMAGGEKYKLGRLIVEYHDGDVMRFLTQRRQKDAMVITLVFLVLALSIIFALHIIVGRPLRRLQFSLNENIEHGRLAPLPWFSNDELGDVVSSYNALLDEVESQRENLQQMNETLRTEIGQRKAAEKDLELAAKIFEVSIEGIAITDSKGCIQNVNQSFERITGFSAHEVSGRNLRDVKTGMGDAETYTEIWDNVKTFGHWSGEIWNKRKSGDEYAAQLDIVRMGFGNGDSNYQVAVFHEITARKLAEQALLRSRNEFEQQVELRTAELRRANEKLLELDKLRSSFLSSVSHELRTPLTSVRGFVKLVKRDLKREYSAAETRGGNGQGAPIPPKAARILFNLGIVEEEGARLTRLIDDLLDLNKIESGRMQWRDETMDAGAEAFLAIQSMGLALETKELTLSHQVERETPKLFMDRDRFRQIMINLLSNAIKFTPEGEVRVTVGQSAPGVVQVRVSDNGVGIPQEHLEHVFQRFYQGEGPGKDKPKGTGLGLSICKHIVEHYNGRIWAESSPGRGSVIIVELPARDEA